MKKILVLIFGLTFIIALTINVSVKNNGEIVNVSLANVEALAQFEGDIPGAEILCNRYPRGEGLCWFYIMPFHCVFVGNPIYYCTGIIY